MSSSEDVVFRAYFHCDGCARDASNCLRGFDGVERVTIDAANQRIAVRGENVDPLRVLKRLRKKFSRSVELISPIPHPPAPKEEDPPKKEEIVIRTVVLRILMHCTGCVNDIERSIYKMKGVLEVEAELETGKVTVTGAFKESKLLNYVRKHVNKYAEIVPLPPSLADEKPTEKDEAAAEEAMVVYFPQNWTDHKCPCEMFNDENADSCCVM